MAVSSPHLQESGIHFSDSFSHGRFTKLVIQCGLSWFPSYRAYTIFYSWLKSFTPIMQTKPPQSFAVETQSSCSVLYLCAVPGWFPGLQLGCSICFMQSNHSKESHVLPSQTWWWSSVRMHTNHSDHPLLPQVIAVSCDNSEVPAGTQSHIQIVKMLFFFQAEWLYYINQTHHTDNPMPVPTQNMAQNYTEPAWVKQIWNHTHRK